MAAAAPPSSAMHRALEVTEILEHILERVALADIAPPVFNTHHEEPSAKLFQLQRVSTRFREVIRASIKLQQLMFLAPLDASVRVTTMHRAAPIVWLLKSLGVEINSVMESRIGGSGESACLIELQDVDLARPQRPGFDPMLFELATKVRDCSASAEAAAAGGAGGAAAEASWRGIKVSNARECGTILVHFTVIIGWWFVEDEDEEHVAEQEVTWKFSQGTTARTLGEVFDRYVGVVERLRMHDRLQREADYELRRARTESRMTMIEAAREDLMGP
ncbi:Hypothetical predicted protein [Lecanosticta acicola]|uniref:Uncharacterized protein n=1 Tax=Lecanosticta acicola TaxID=111012 RepID=A0AAI8YZ42_9PEZI|nr:Hypothetical predicted protein [Lecanosticta acicola]